MSKLPWNYLKMDQQSPEWLHARCGCVTASRVKDVMAKLKNGKESAARYSYKMELLGETLTGSAADHYVSAPMMHGIETEPLARNMYEMERSVEVERIGFVLHPKINRSGASPDGLIGDDGILEIKCPNTTTHLEYFLAEEMPEQYVPQVQWQLACTGRKWADFVSYDSRLPAEFSLFIIRIERDDKAIGDMEREVECFIKELNQMCESLLKNKRTPSSFAGSGPEAAELPQVASWLP